MNRYTPPMTPRQRFVQRAVPAKRIAGGALCIAVCIGLTACFEQAPEPDAPTQGGGVSSGDAGQKKSSDDAGPRRKAEPTADDDAGSDDGPTSCGSDADCDNSMVCDGVERCVLGACLAGDPPVCPPEHACSEATHGCDCTDPDHDGDGVLAIICGGGPKGDCDDDQRDVYPGQVELCDPGTNVDEDCDYHTHGELDADGDGEDSDQCCNPAPDGSLSCEGDCDDSKKNVNDRATEACDGIDNDCNGYLDELPNSAKNGSLEGTFYRDADGDSQGDPKDTVRACVQPEGYASEPGDCADSEPQWFTGGTEICDGEDNDCDGIVDEDVTLPAIARTTPECRGHEGLAIKTCEPGYLDCAGGVTDGCETPITTLHDCQACGRTCDFACGSDTCDEIEQLSAGETNTCAITRQGVATCWGSNSYGQIGDDTTPPALIPHRVGVLGPVERIAVGGAHACAIESSDGTLYCWGDNRHGQLGVFNGPDASTVPIRVNGIGVVTSMLSGVSAIAAGRNHTCAIADGAALCWGQGDSGQLGTNTYDDADSPRSVLREGTLVPVGNAAAIVAGTNHTCIVTRDRTVECWGRNGAGQLGRTDGGKVVNAASAAPVVGLSDVEALAAGANHTCALSGGAVYCWGQNASGQLGGSTTTETGVPRTTDDTARQVPGLSGIVSIAAGLEVTCAVDADGALYCWGGSNYGELGRINAGSNTPIAIPIAPVAEVSAGGGHICAQLINGPVLCWGHDTQGQLGDEQSTIDPQPLPRKLHWLYGSEP